MQGADAGWTCTPAYDPDVIPPRYHVGYLVSKKCIRFFPASFGSFFWSDESLDSRRSPATVPVAPTDTIGAVLHDIQAAKA